MNYTFEQLDKINFKHKYYDSLNQVISNFELRIYILVEKPEAPELCDIGLITAKNLFVDAIMKYRIKIQDGIRTHTSWVHNNQILFITDDIREIKKYMLLQ